MLLERRTARFTLRNGQRARRLCQSNQRTGKLREQSEATIDVAQLIVVGCLNWESAWSRALSFSHLVVSGAMIIAGQESASRIRHIRGLVVFARECLHRVKRGKPHHRHELDLVGKLRSSQCGAGFLAHARGQQHAQKRSGIARWAM
jgi:hypothetical protein